MAALPAVYAVRKLLSADYAAPGSLTAHELVGVSELLDSLAADGFEVMFE